MSPSKETANQSGRVDISGTVAAVHGDIVGRDKITVGLDEESLVNALDARGLLQAAELAGLQKRVIVDLARRLKRDLLDFDQAIVELESVSMLPLM